LGLSTKLPAVYFMGVVFRFSIVVVKKVDVAQKRSGGGVGFRAEG